MTFAPLPRWRLLLVLLVLMPAASCSSARDSTGSRNDADKRVAGVANPPAGEQEMIELLNRLTRLLSTDPLSVTDLVEHLGTVVDDQGKHAAVIVQPSDRRLRQVQIFRHPRTGAPDVVTLTLAAGQGLTLATLREAFGSDREVGGVHFEEPREYLFRVDHSGMPYTVAIIVKIDRRATDPDQAEVTELSLRRDVRL